MPKNLEFDVIYAEDTVDTELLVRVKQFTDAGKNLKVCFDTMDREYHYLLAQNLWGKLQLENNYEMRSNYNFGCALIKKGELL